MRLRLRLIRRRLRQWLRSWWPPRQLDAEWEWFVTDDLVKVVIGGRFGERFTVTMPIDEARELASWLQATIILSQTGERI
jgi:hypothetical protein